MDGGGEDSDKTLLWTEVTSIQVVEDINFYDSASIARPANGNTLA